MDNKNTESLVTKTIFKSDSLDNATKLLNKALASFKNEMNSAGANSIQFFPNGIDLIELSIGTSGVTFKVAGPSK